jgi:hypothetical protein
MGVKLDKKMIFGIISLFLLSWVSSGFAADLTIAWDPPLSGAEVEG